MFIFFTKDRRNEINKQFWILSYAERRNFASNYCERLEIKKGLQMGLMDFVIDKLKDCEINWMCKHFYFPLCDTHHEITGLSTKYFQNKSTAFYLKFRNRQAESYNPVIFHYGREHARQIFVFYLVLLL